MFQGWVGCADTKGLFACCPHSLGIACEAGHPRAAIYANASASWLPSPSQPASLCPWDSSESAPKGKGFRVSQSPWILPSQRGNKL